MIKEPTNESFFYSQIGALEAEIQRVNKEKQELKDQNDILRTRLYLNDLPHDTEMETKDGKD
jgi:regulator of replication initiation timing